ncbi:hypothetical protein A0H81_00993 [Grifola frondosa]|uniref:Uncharacterized protein n=1 Tax=Grifola frondosa TaxID=5627 RepID=A0A1C7MSB2_GRIFR|nr:hypothetical protein A0H81_00993 [Grifola frondosa]
MVYVEDSDEDTDIGVICEDTIAELSSARACTLTDHSGPRSRTNTVRTVKKSCLYHFPAGEWESVSPLSVRLCALFFPDDRLCGTNMSIAG